MGGAFVTATYKSSVCSRWLALQVRVTLCLWVIIWSPYAFKQTLHGHRRGELCLRFAETPVSSIQLHP